MRLTVRALGYISGKSTFRLLNIDCLLSEKAENSVLHLNKPEQEPSLSLKSVSRRVAGVQLRESHRFSRLPKPHLGAETKKNG